MAKHLVVSPVSNKGKSLVAQFGDEWTIICHDKPACTKGNPAFLAFPKNGDKNKSRWIEQMGDSEFQIIFIKDDLLS